MNWQIILSLVELSWIAGLVIWILMERRSPTATLAWIMCLGLIPVLGIVVYLVFGPRRLLRRRVRYLGARDALSKARVLQDEQEVPLSQDVLQLQQLAIRAGQAPLERARVELFDAGDEAYASILTAVAAARHHVHVEYYIWENDHSGRALRDALIERARAGVQVRVLYDSLGSGSLPGSFFEGLEAVGGKVAVFNPLRWVAFRPRLVNFRTHRKIVVIDGIVGFTGGMNMSDCHCVKHSKEAAWRDTHTRLEGAGVHGLQVGFAENWHFATEELIGAREYYPPSTFEDGVPTQILRSGPDRSVYPIHEFHFAAITMADTRVWITTPYLVLDDPMIVALRTAVSRGVDVRLLVPSKNDSKLVAAAMRSYYEDLLAGGVKIYEYKPRMLHAKTMVVDDTLALVGTANMDPRSFRLNFEIAAAIYDRSINETLATWFERDQTFAEEVRPRVMRDEPFTSRLFESAARLFSPIL